MNTYTQLIRLISLTSALGVAACTAQSTEETAAADVAAADLSTGARAASLEAQFRAFHDGTASAQAAASLLTGSWTEKNFGDFRGPLSFGPPNSPNSPNSPGEMSFRATARVGRIERLIALCGENGARVSTGDDVLFGLLKELTPEQVRAAGGSVNAGDYTIPVVGTAIVNVRTVKLRVSSPSNLPAAFARTIGSFSVSFWTTSTFDHSFESCAESHGTLGGTVCDRVGPVVHVPGDGVVPLHGAGGVWTRALSTY